MWLIELLKVRRGAVNTRVRLLRDNLPYRIHALQNEAATCVWCVPGEPTNAGECGAILKSSSKWKTQKCTRTNSYICKKLGKYTTLIFCNSPQLLFQIGILSLSSGPWAGRSWISPCLIHGGHWSLPVWCLWLSWSLSGITTHHGPWSSNVRPVHSSHGGIGYDVETSWT